MVIFNSASKFTYTMELHISPVKVGIMVMVVHKVTSYPCSHRFLTLFLSFSECHIGKHLRISKDFSLQIFFWAYKYPQLPRALSLQSPVDISRRKLVQVR